MNDSKWERWSSLGGAAFAVLVAVTAFLPGEPPKVTDSAGKIAKFFADKNGELRWSAYLSGIALILALWWGGAVWRFMRRAEGGVPRLAVVAIGGLILANVTALISALVWSAVAMLGFAGAGGAGGTKAFFVIGWVIGSATVFGAAAFVGAFSAVIIRTAALPRILGWFGVVIAAAGIVGGGAVASTRDVFIGFSLVILVGLVVWVLITSILMMRHTPIDANTSSAPAMSASPT